MSDSLDRQGKVLKEKFPRLFAAYQGELGPDIWYPRGWTQLVEDLFSAIDKLLSDEQAKMFSAEQVKEKYGGLRFYFSVRGKLAVVNIDINIPGAGIFRQKQRPTTAQDFPLEDVERLIDAAEKVSESTCAFCGSLGSMRNDGWIYVSCDACETKRREQKQSDVG